MEQQIDSDFDDIVRKVTDVLQTERDRLVGIGQQLESSGQPVSYRRTAEFSRLLGMLETVEIGKFKEESSEKENGSQVSSSSCNDDKTRVSDKRNRKRASCDRSVYDDMELVATVDTKDFGFDRPHSIIAMPHPQNCFALLRPGRLAFVSPSGTLLSSPWIMGGAGRRTKLLGNYCPHVLARNPLDNQLICVDYGNIKSLSITDWPNCGNIQAEVLVPGADYKLPLGLAISASTKRLFTGVENCIKSYSTNDWQSRGKWRMELIDKSNYPYVLGEFDGKLFFREGDFAKKLFTVEINEADGTLNLESEALFADSFISPRDITFDAHEHVLGIDDRDCSFQVFDKDGIRLCNVPCYKRGTERGRTVSLATMTVPSGGELFSFHGGEILCSDIVAVVDFSSSSILYLGSSQSS